MKKQPFQDHIQKIVDRIKYRHWEFEVCPCVAIRSSGTEMNFVEIAASCESVDADGSDVVNVIGKSELLPKDATPAMVVEAVYTLIERIEHHERREFFQFDGKKIYDPHILKVSSGNIPKAIAP